jgi:hypothetical protein
MAKQRIIAGYALKQEGVIAPGESIRCYAEIPADAPVRDIQIDMNGNFVLFAEVWSHPEGTKVNFRKVEYYIMMTGKVWPSGSWQYAKTLVSGPAVFHVLTKDKTEIVT